MPSFKFNKAGIKKMCDYIQKDVDRVLNTTIATQVKDEIVMSVHEIIYSPNMPKPRQYVRRGENGGLRDKDNMEHEVKNGVLKVINVTEPKKQKEKLRDLAKNIEYGYWRKDEWWNKPRPFMQNAIDSLNSDSVVADLMKESLQKYGYKTE